MQRLKKWFWGALAAASLAAVGGNATARTGAPVDGNPWPLSAQGDFDLSYSTVTNVSNYTRDWYLPAIIDNSGSKTMTIYGTASSTGNTVCRGVASTPAGSLTVGSPVSITSIFGVASVTTPAVTVPASGTFVGYCTLVGGGASLPTLKSYSYSQ